MRRASKTSEVVLMVILSPLLLATMVGAIMAMLGIAGLALIGEWVSSREAKRAS